ncbi:MAG TPA: ATP-binding protein [Candidatus Nanoarchaeia archaeon]|nr:ATP-binding protein [Candidatus Nanoarchaeia archaeon]
MKEEIIRDIIIDQNNYPKKEFIEREQIKEIIKAKDTPFIKIISGVRRSGKSTILKQLKEKFSGVYINFDDERFVSFNIEDFQKLYELSIELFKKNNLFYFDEIQNISGWERFVRRISESGENVFVTGSNATMLSKELGTHLTGRYLMFNLYPFSFREYLDFNKIKISKLTTKEKVKIKEQFSNYLIDGGLPEYLITKNKDYLRTLYESILYRDVMARYNLNNEKVLKELIYLVANNLSKEISFNSIKKTLGVGSATTISDYFSYFENTYLLFLLPRYKYSLKTQIQSNKKLYLIDNALAKQLGFNFSENNGKLLENQVFLELKRKGYELFYFQEKNECDFLIREKNKIINAIQVCYELNSNNKNREINGLIEVMNEFKLNEGTIITLNQEETIKEEKLTIKIIPAWKWFLN